MDLKRPTQKYIIIKLAKLEDKKNLKSCMRKAVTYLQESSRKTVI